MREYHQKLRLNKQIKENVANKGISTDALVRKLGDPCIYCTLINNQYIDAMRNLKLSPTDYGKLPHETACQVYLLLICNVMLLVFFLLFVDF